MARLCCLFPLLGILTVIASAMLLVSCSPRNRAPQRLALRLQSAELPADGYSDTVLTISRVSGAPASKSPVLQLSGNPYSARLQRIEGTSNGWRVRIRAGIVPGKIAITAAGTGFSPATVPFTLRLATGDTFRDGTPDFLQLEDPADEAAFRRWFTFLAEIQYFTPPSDRPAEIVDCSALLRYAYREALRSHNASWCGTSHLPLIPAIGSIEKYAYPQTPLGANLFRLRAGSFSPSNLRDGTFGQFANAETLQKLNTFFISRDIARARPGDLLFYRRPAEHVPYHSMIFVGRSQVTPGKTSYIVYNTGPDGTKAGEIRRRSLEELLNYPDPQWQPRWTNPYFLGIFRWNILRTAS